MMARVSSKRLIPIELLRRSTRRLCPKGSSPDCDQNKAFELSVAIKKEKNIVDDATKPRDLVINAKRLKLETKQSLEGCQVDCQPTGAVEQSIKLEPDGYMQIDADELDLERTLLGGQSFRWVKESNSSKDGDQTIFTGTISRNVLQIWRCDSKRIAYRNLTINFPDNISKQDSKNSIETLLEDYFQLKYKLKDLYEYWSERDENFSKCSKHYKGFRILRQDPVENVLSFICATNNNIKRISLMVAGLCRRFGQQLEPRKHITMTKVLQDRFFTFPEVERLAEDDVFNILRYELGFGYRAKFVCETAKKLVQISSQSNFDSPRDYLISLRQAPYKETCKQLQAFPGIGRKVADCICLMSMDHLCSVPIDCHIYEIVCRNYMKTLRQERKTLTEKVHDLIGDYFVDLHGPLAGWATSVLFVGELKHLKPGSAANKSAKANNTPKKLKEDLK